MARLAFTVKQAAAEANSEVRDIVKAIRAGHLTAHIQGTRIIIPSTALEAWMILWPCVPANSVVGDERLDVPVGVEVTS